MGSNQGKTTIKVYCNHGGLACVNRRKFLFFNKWYLSIHICTWWLSR